MARRFLSCFAFRDRLDGRLNITLRRKVLSAVSRLVCALCRAWIQAGKNALGSLGAADKKSVHATIPGHPIFLKLPEISAEIGSSESLRHVSRHRARPTGATTALRSEFLRLKGR